jgi:hypothetical protein
LQLLTKKKKKFLCVDNGTKEDFDFG